MHLLKTAMMSTYQQVRPSPDAPYFWQSEKDGSTTGTIEIITEDSIVWKNADTAVHTVTSGTVEEGPDDIFDSGMFGPGKSFTQKFSETGNYPYYCLLHPWMIGTVIVTDGYSIIPDVGKNAGDGSMSFDVEYDFNRLLSSPTINEDEKSITFSIVGVTKSDSNDPANIAPIRANFRTVCSFCRQWDDRIREYW